MTHTLDAHARNEALFERQVSKIHGMKGFFYH
jgi:hypothetical protein